MKIRRYDYICFKTPHGWGKIDLRMSALLRLVNNKQLKLLHKYKHIVR